MVKALPYHRTRPATGKTLVVIQADPRVATVDDERGMGNNIIITLKKGWTFTAGEDNRVDGGATPTEALKVLRSAKKHPGPYTD